MIKINYDNFPAFLDILQEKYQIFAPTKNGSETSFSPIIEASQIASINCNTTLSPKNVFFPQSEVIFTYDKKGMHTPKPAHKPILIWGLHPCDTRSIRMLNKVFGNAYQMPDKEMYKDKYWIDKYEDSLLFTLACNLPASTCFCNWFQSSPFDQKGSDVFVIDTGYAYLMEGVSDAGKKLLSNCPGEEINQQDKEMINSLKLEAENRLGAVPPLENLLPKLTKLWNDPIWDKIAAKCINCGACAYTCPTCHCFDISDEGNKEKGQRIRIWDCCMFGLFTKEASGHNPRDLSTNRVRQRIMHKYSYFVENYGEYLCTGCGRCVQVCPVNLDIRQVIKQLLEYKIPQNKD